MKNDDDEEETHGAQSRVISEEQLQVIGRRYEFLRRKKLYGVDEPKRGHYRKSQLRSFVKRCGESFIADCPQNCSIEVELKIRFPVRREKNIWQEYGNAVLRLFQAFTTGGKHGSTKRSAGEGEVSPLGFNLTPFEEIGSGMMMGYRMVCSSNVARYFSEKIRVPSLKDRLESLMELLDLLLYPESFDEALPPIILTVRTFERENFGSGRLETELSSSSFELPTPHTRTLYNPETSQISFSHSTA